MKVRNFTMKRWDFSLEGMVCPVCKGKESVLEKGDLHRSEGIVPCPMGYFQGHGYPTCGKKGKLHFSEYDIENKDSLMKKYPSEEENKTATPFPSTSIRFLKNQ